MDQAQPYKYKDAATLLADFWSEVDRYLKEKGEGSSEMKTLRVGIASYEDMKARSLAIAQGKYRPTADEPKVWFASAESFARILSDRNRVVLQTIAEHAPDSLARLAELTGREKSNLSRTLKTMERYGFVKLERGPRGSVITKVPYQRISLVLPL